MSYDYNARPISHCCMLMFPKDLPCHPVDHFDFIDFFSKNTHWYWQARQWQPGRRVTDAPQQRLLIGAPGLYLQKVNEVLVALPRQIAFENLHFRGQCAGNSWLQLDFSCQLHTAELKEHLDNMAFAMQVELCLLPQTLPDLQQPGLLLLDMDSTLIAMECIDQIAHLAGVGPQVAEVTAAAMAGELDFIQSLQQRVACLAGTPEGVLRQVRDALPLMPGATALVTRLKQAGWKVAVASGGFTCFTDYLQQRLGLDAAFANQLEVTNGKLTGQVQGQVVDSQFKANCLAELGQRWQIPESQWVAMGDGANDLPMLNKAALGVSMHGKALVRQQADVALRFAGLDGLLAVLGEASRGNH